MRHDGVRPRLAPNDAAEFRVYQNVRVQNRVGLNLAHRQVVGVDVVERLAEQHRLDALHVHRAVGDAFSVPPMRHGIAGDVAERQFVFVNVPAQHLAGAAIARIPDLHCLCDAVVVNVRFDVADIEVDKLRRLERIRRKRDGLSVARQPLFILNHDGVGGQVLDFLPVPPVIAGHFHEVGTGHAVMEIRHKPGLFDGRGFGIEEEILRLARLDADLAARLGALHLDIVRLDRDLHHLPGLRVGHRHEVRLLVFVAGQNLNVRILHHQGQLLAAQARMAADVGLWRRVPVVPDDAVAEREAVMRGIVKRAIPVVVPEKHVVGIVGRLLGELLVLLRLRLIHDHLVRRGEHAHDARQYPRHGVAEVAGNDR